MRDTVLRGALKQFTQHNTKSLQLIPDLVSPLVYEQALQNCIFSDSFVLNLAEMKAKASLGRQQVSNAAGQSMKLQRVSTELRPKACADLSKLNLSPDSITVSFPGIYYLDRADKNKQRKKDHSVMQSNLNCPFVFVL